MQRLVGSGKGPSRFGDESNYAASRRFRQGSEQIRGRTSKGSGEPAVSPEPSLFAHRKNGSRQLKNEFTEAH